jgi:serine/threonine protein phosphatase PrpC
MNQPISPERVADQLYEAAMAAGGHDNITAVVVEVS